MTHDEAVLLLTDLLAGRLAPEVRRRVQDHLAGCAECASLVETHEMLAGRHTPVDDLVDLSLQPDAIEKGRRLRLQAHLEVCEACGAEARRVRRAEKTAVAAIAGSNRFGSASLLMSAAAAALLSLGLSAYLGLYRIPRLESTIDRLQAVPPRRVETAPHAGEPGPMVRIQYLPSTRRGPGSDATVALDPEQPYQYLAIEVPEFKPQGAYTIEIDADGGGPVWSRSVSADDLHRLLQGTPEVTLAVPTTALHPGRFLVRLRAASEPQSAPLIDTAFQVRTAH
jgi:hypothetical protein